MQGILLAAGRSTRFGSNKLLYPLDDGTPMALAAARNIKAALPEVLAVVNGQEPVLAALLQQAGLHVTVCPGADAGMATSLAWGVAQSINAGGWLIALADMPWIRPGTIRAVAVSIATPRTIAAPTYQGRRGHPVAFGRAYGQELMALTGDQGARRLLASHAAEVVLQRCQDPGVLRDVDLRQQLG